MPDAPFPTLDEFWKRLEARHVEDDLRAALRERTGREERHVERVGPETTVIAVVERLLPGVPVPARALAVFVDEMFDRQLGRGDERSGTLPRGEMMPAGFAALDDAAGGNFSTLPPDRQDHLLADAERGALRGPPGFDSSAWFSGVRSLVLLGFGSDPRGMVFMGYPGPSYEPGHVWLRGAEVKQRVERRTGYQTL